jgi:V/A-type H+/Na+-transporting ATPase subunit F
MSTIRVVGRPAACAGFALAGVAVAEVAGAREGSAVIEELAGQPDVGVLLIEQDLLDALGEPERRELMDRPSPIVVPFPSASWKEQGPSADAYVLELLQRAIGYRVRLR